MHLLRQRRFALLLGGLAVNAIGSWTSLIAIWGYATYRYHAGPAVVALLVACWSGPAAILGPLAGLPIDRFGPRRVLLCGYVLTGVVAVAMARSTTLGALIALVVTYGVLRAFTIPAADALPPRVVEPRDLLAANAMFGVTEQLAIVVGPLAASIAIGVAGVGAAFWFDAGTYLVGAAAVSGLRMAPVPRAEGDGVVGQIGVWAGVAALWASRPLRLVLALATATFVMWGGFAVVEPLYVRQVLHRPPSQLGLFQVAFGVGLVATAPLVPRFGERVIGVRPLSLCLIASAAGSMLYVGTRSILVAYVGVIIWGISGAFFWAPTVTLLQRGAPVAIHGRVLGAFRSLNGWTNLLALPVIGITASAWGVRNAALAMGVVSCTTATLGLVWSRSRPVLCPVGGGPTEEPPSSPERPPGSAPDWPF